MSGHDYSDTNEETISGDLCETIDKILDEGKEAWMTSYHVKNEKPVQQTWLEKNQRDREGKKRQKIDIEFCSHASSPRRTFPIEAKLLCNSSSVSSYVGSGGIGCFINGEYSRGENVAAMAGFIQNRTPEDWMKLIETKMKGKKSDIKLQTPPTWEDTSYVVSGLPVKLSHHGRKQRLPSIDLHHIFFDFSPL